MGKMDGFLEYSRVDDSVVKPLERIRSFDEFHIPLKEEDRRQQAARCMNCGVPYCQSALKLKGMVTGCPLHNLIPEWNDEIYKGNPGHALARLLKMSSFPEFTSRVCPALCEKACINGLDDHPVSIHDNEKWLIEYAFENGMMTPRIPEQRSTKKVAVIGSGPAGLAAADVLNRRGHNVTVYEREDRPGGLLMYGIPNMKLDKKIVERRISLMKAEGISFVLNADVGRDTAAEDIRKEYDAVILACGSKQPRSLSLEGIETCGDVHFAVDFLKSTTVSLLKDGFKEEDCISAKGKHVVIVGGGDTGNDCVGTCIRHGCASVTQIEMMPALPVERREDNPWPEWPKVLKTDYGQEEAIAVFGNDPRVYETTVTGIVQEDGKLKAVRIAHVHFEDRRPVIDKESEKEIPCELLLIAAGFTGCETYTAEAFETALTPRGTVSTAEGVYMTDIPGVFTAGDMHRGQSLVVWAIREGRECAVEADRWMMGYTDIS